VCHFAVEAAARHHWQTLLEVQFELLRFDLAEIAKLLFQGFKARGIVVNNIDPSLASSRERSDRVAARLKSDGMLPLLTTYVAALTILDQFNMSTTSMFTGLQAEGVMRRFDRQIDIFELQRRVLDGHPRGAALAPRFRENCEKMALVFLASHADALKLHVHHLSVIGHFDTTKLDRLYDQVLKASIGPNRVLIPTVESLRNNQVDLPLTVWGECYALRPN
jgi:hypothetical protein